MIFLKEVKRYCQEYWKIENYQEAVNDTTQTWDCHHRFEIDHNMTVLELQAMGFYFNRPFYELIFLTHGEHSSLHNKGKHYNEEFKKKISDAKKGRFVGENNPFYGRSHTEETKQKISDTKKEQKRGPLSEETKQKISDANKGKPKSEETKQKISDTLKGKLSGENNPNYKYHITAEELYDLYIVQGLSRKQIAELYGCTPQLIWLKLKKYGIIKHGK